jgi:hypothetical protein
MENKNTKTIGSVVIVVITVFVGFFVLRQEPVTEPRVTQEQAESIAEYTFSNCWQGGYLISSYSSTLMQFEGETVWRIGGNYEYEQDAIVQNTVYGNIPEVLVDADTGYIVSKHFTEVDEPKKGCESPVVAGPDMEVPDNGFEWKRYDDQNELISLSISDKQELNGVVTINGTVKKSFLETDGFSVGTANKYAQFYTYIGFGQQFAVPVTVINTNGDMVDFSVTLDTSGAEKGIGYLRIAQDVHSARGRSIAVPVIFK